MRKDPKRFLTQTEKAELLNACDFKCQGIFCNDRDLYGKRYEFHYIKQHSQGGLTTRYQHLVLCEPCHKREHAVNQVNLESLAGIWPHLRGWQRDALERFCDADSNGEKFFVLEAAPGAGKSMFAACVTRLVLDNHPEINHAICIAPWTPILSSMKRTFGRMELDVRDKFHYDKSRGELQLHPMQDVTLDTYQGFCNEDTVRVLASWKRRIGFRFMLILDEVHHTNTIKGSWGGYGERIAELADKVVVMSGTYFRSDSRPITFLEYENEKPKTHFSISYSECVRNRYVRQIAFRYIDPLLEIYNYDKQKTSQSLLSNIPYGSKKIVKAVADEVLDPQGPHVEMLINEAWSQLQGMRKKWPDAACLVVCKPGSGSSEERNVHAIESRIKALTGVVPSVVTGDDSASRGRIEAFARSTEPFLCAIRMVSEGVDIPRIRMVLFVSKTDSEMLFRQIAGRALRYIAGQEDDTAALVIMPKFPRMHDFAKRFETEADVVLNPVETSGESGVCGSCFNSPCSCDIGFARECTKCQSFPCKCFVVLNSTVLAGGGLISDSLVHEKHVEAAKIVVSRYQQHQHANVIQLADALQKASELNVPGVSANHEEAKSLLLSNVNRKVSQIALHRYQRDYAAAWAREVHDRFGADMLEIRSTWRLEQISELDKALKARLVEVINGG